MHVSVHQGQATADINFLQCEHCNKKFTRQQVLDKHMEFHSPARRFDCPTCGLRFKTRPALAAHVAAHTASRPYVCSICSKGFKSSTALKGTRPHQTCCRCCSLTLHQHA